MARIFALPTKGWRGQDHHHRQPGRRARQGRPAALLVDLDPQGNATMGSGVDKRQLGASVYDVLLESTSIKRPPCAGRQGGYHVLGANRELAGAEVELVILEHRERRSAALAGGGSGLRLRAHRLPAVAIHADAQRLCSANGVIVPHAVRVLRARRPDGSGQHHQAGARQPEPRPADHRLARRDVRPAHHAAKGERPAQHHFGDKVFDTVIPRNAGWPKRQLGLPGVVFDPRQGQPGLCGVCQRDGGARCRMPQPSPENGQNGLPLLDKRQSI